MRCFWPAFSVSEAPTSKTDIHGNITYVNQDFVNISGFSEDELLGQPHNIVRHPDMPVEAFADLWNTLRSGKPWTGIVKNRCKNGDHYWVEANAAPIFENGKIVGFTSVRGKPAREQVQAAEGAYRAVKAGDKTLAIREGKASSGLRL
jgi:aerotaxis receptor